MSQELSNPRKRGMLSKCDGLIKFDASFTNANVDFMRTNVLPGIGWGALITVPRHPPRKRRIHKVQ